MKLFISTGNSRMEKKWNGMEMELEDFRERISHTIRTAETVEQYRKLSKAKQDDIKDVGWAYSAYEWAAIPGTIICGWLSDKVFKGRRAITTMIYMALVAVFVVIYWKNMDSVLLDNISLIAIGFLIYGPVMLIGVQALDLAPKKAAGTAAGLTGFFGYFFGTAILANIAMGSIVQHLGWDWGFIMLLAACALAFLFISFTYREEQYLVKQRK